MVITRTLDNGESFYDTLLRYHENGSKNAWIMTIGEGKQAYERD